MQERTGLPSSSTVHAPHWARPQPNFAACRPSAFRKMYRSGWPGSQESTDTARPLTRNSYLGISSLLLRKAMATVAGFEPNLHFRLPAIQMVTHFASKPLFLNNAVPTNFL